MIALFIKALTSRLAGPAASIVAVILLALCVGQCTGRLRAEHRADKAEKVAQDAKRDLQTCRANAGALRASLDAQNAALDDLGRQAAETVARVEKERQAAREDADRATRAASELSKVRPAGADLCARMLDVDAQVKEIAG